MVRRLTPTSSQAFMIEIVLRSTWVLASTFVLSEEAEPKTRGLGVVKYLTGGIVQTLNGRAAHREDRFGCPAADVRSRDEVWQAQQLAIGGRLLGEHVARRARKRPIRERMLQRRFVDDAAARGVD